MLFLGSFEENRDHEEAWKCLCKGVTQKKGKGCPEGWMSEYYCAYCYGKEMEMEKEQKVEKKQKKKNKDLEARKSKNGPKSGAGSTSADLGCDPILEKFQPCFNGTVGRLGFPRGNFIPRIRVRLPETWKPDRCLTGKEHEETICLQGNCPCCGSRIPKDSMMIK